jgi:Putative transposase
MGYCNRLLLNPHFHTLLLDGVYAPGRDGGAPILHPAPGPTQEEVEAVVQRAGKRILRYLERRGVITVVAAPGDGESNVFCDDALGDKDPLLARLLAAATTGAAPAGPARKRAPVRIVQQAGGPVQKGKLCAQDCGFNLHAATRVAANDRPGRATLCRYILRPPLANDRLQLLPDGTVQLAFKRAWSDGTNSVLLEPLALIARLAALVPPPRRHITRYFGVLSSHSKLRSQVVPAQPAPAETAPKPPAETQPPRPGRYIPWAELLRRTYDIDVLACQGCGGRLRLIALVKTEATITKILGAMGLPTLAPKLHPARPPPSSTGRVGDGEPAGDQDRCN